MLIALTCFSPYRLLSCPALVACALTWLMGSSLVLAQPAFNPPPSPNGVLQHNSPPAPTTSQTANERVQLLEGGQIVAKVDGQIVLASDVLWQVDQLLKANAARIPPDKLEEVKQVLLRKQVMTLLDTKMIYANFRRQVPDENVPKIEENLRKPFEEAEVPRLIEMLGLQSRNELIEMLEASGTSLADVRRQFIERTIAGEWLRQMIDKPKEATHEQMLDYYHAHKKDFQYPAKVKWEELMVSFDRTNNDRAAAWKSICEMGNEVWMHVVRNPQLRGAVFSEIAKAKSHGFNAQSGGQHEWTTKGSLRSKELNEALFTYQIGQMSNVITSDQGYHIIRVLDRTEAGCTPFTEAQATIREALTKDQRGELAEAKLQELRKKSRVWTIYDGQLSMAELMNRDTNPVRR